VRRVAAKSDLLNRSEFMTQAIRARDIGAFLDLPVHGEDCLILSVSSFTSPKPNTMIFVERSTAEAWERISPLPEALVICPDELGISLTCATIWSDNPRLPFIRAINRFFKDQVTTPFKPGVGPGSVVSLEATIGKDVSIGCNCVIGAGVSIGANTIILNNVVISGRTQIGGGCFIKSGAVIGETGFGFCLDELGIPVQMPHFGDVVIGNGVSIGANSTIERGIFDSTVISDHVKIDDLVQIGHNVNLGKGVQIAAGTILCGAVHVGQQTWIAPNVTALERTQIGKNAYVGLAANVLKDVPDNAVVVGNPAKRLTGPRSGQ
jgi:UDP-3-O-[3-hydroxymyristoyl] glucosamine N-acyltransferase LpxD